MKSLLLAVALTSGACAASAPNPSFMPNAELDFNTTMSCLGIVSAMERTSTVNLKPVIKAFATQAKKLNPEDDKFFTYTWGYEHARAAIVTGTMARASNKPQVMLLRSIFHSLKCVVELTGA